MALPDAVLPAADAAAPVATDTYDKEEEEPRSNCRLLMGVDPGEKDTESLTAVPGPPLAVPTDREAVCASP
jgi:hypothetical protein